MDTSREKRSKSSGRRHRKKLFRAAQSVRQDPAPNTNLDGGSEVASSFDEQADTDLTASTANREPALTANTSKKRKHGGENQAQAARSIFESANAARNLELVEEDSGTEDEPHNKRLKVSNGQYSTAPMLKTPQASKRKTPEQIAATRITPPPPTTTNVNFEAFAHSIFTLSRGAARMCTYIGTQGRPIAVLAGGLIDDFCNFLAGCVDAVAKCKVAHCQAPPTNSAVSELPTSSLGNKALPVVFRPLPATAYVADQRATPRFMGSIPLKSATFIVSAVAPPAAPDVKSYRRKMIPQLIQELSHAKKERLKRASRPSTSKSPQNRPQSLPRLEPMADLRTQTASVAISRHGISKLDLFQYRLRDTILSKQEVIGFYFCAKHHVLPHLTADHATLARAKEVVADGVFAVKCQYEHFFLMQWIAKFEQINKENEMAVFAQRYAETAVSERELPFFYALHQDAKILESITPTENDLDRLRVLIADDVLKQLDPTAYAALCKYLGQSARSTWGSGTSGEQTQSPQATSDSSSKTSVSKQAKKTGPSRSMKASVVGPRR